MRFTGLDCAADLVGQRIRAEWAFALDADESEGDIPDVLLRRKRRDYEFPPLALGDPYLVYDSASFPPPPVPGSVSVVDLPGQDWFEGTERLIRRAVSVGAIAGQETREILREIRVSRYDGLGRLIEQRVELVDGTGLPELETLYYELDDGSTPDAQELGRYRGTAVVGKLHGHNRHLWELIPQVYRSRDELRLPDAARIPGVPETRGNGGQLRRFVDVFGLGFDALRNSVEALPTVRDLDQARPDCLELLGRGIGWQPSETVPLPQRRNEVRGANRLYAVNGTAQSIRTLVTQQTGWRSQLAELAGNVSRANLPASGNLYALKEASLPAGASEWRGGLDCAHAFAFPASAVGAGGAPAVMTSAVGEPFGLRAGDELTIAVDGNVPIRVRFARADFADIGSATATEVATVVNRLVGELAATDQAGSLRLTTLTSGPEASIAVLPERQSLLSTSELPNGTVSPVAHADGTIDVYFRDRQRPTPELAATVFDPAHRSNRIMQKSWRFGMWHDAAPLPRWTGSVEDLDAGGSADGQSLVLWSTGRALALARGVARPEQPAQIVTRARQPFALAAGMQLAMATALGIELIAINAVDFADVSNATAVELAAAINAQLTNATASAQADGAVRLVSVATGSPARLRIELSQSTAARALGLDARELLGRGHWSPLRDWSGPEPGPTCWGPVADPAILARPGGGALAAWAENEGGAWQIRTASLTGRVTAATALGVAERAVPGAAWTLTQIADGLPSDDIRMALADAQGGHWFATDSGLSRRRGDGVFQTFTMADGLVSDDIRAIALLPSGAVACATPAGLSEFLPGGPSPVTTASPTGMVSDDLHSVAAGPAGELWVGSSAGIGRRSASGAWRWWGATLGIPGGAIVSLALASGHPPAAGSAQGVFLHEGDNWRAGNPDGALPAPVRDLAWHPDGTLLVATSGGLGRYRERAWTVETTFTGLPGNDLTAVSWTAEGLLLLGTPSGIIEQQPAGGWMTIGAGDGFPAAPARRIGAGWSAPLAVAASPGGDCEPHLMADTSGETWLFWSHREQAVAGHADDWVLRLARFQVATGWSAPIAITTSPPGGARDRRPRALPLAGGGARLSFATDRSGACATALLALDAIGSPGAIAAFSATSDRATNPALVAGPDGETWLFQRSDMPLVPAQLALAETSQYPVSPSLLVPDAATITQQAGTLTPVMAHAARHGLRARFGDPQTYTEMCPDRRQDDPTAPVPFYTKRTLAVYMRQSPNGKSVTQDEIARLLQLLNRFKPINLRIALVIAPDPLVEFVYPPGADILESWFDNVPLAEVFGPILDTTGVVIPGLGVLLANDLASRSADTLDPATLRRRTWFPDLQ